MNCPYCGELNLKDALRCIKCDMQFKESTPANLLVKDLKSTETPVTTLTNPALKDALAISATPEKIPPQTLPFLGVEIKIWILGITSSIALICCCGTSIPFIFVNALPVFFATATPLPALTPDSTVTPSFFSIEILVENKLQEAVRIEFIAGYDEPMKIYMPPKRSNSIKIPTNNYIWQVFIENSSCETPKSSLLLKSAIKIVIEPDSKNPCGLQARQE